MLTSVWHVHTNTVSASFMLPSHPVLKRMTNFLYIFFIVHAYGCCTLSSMHKRMYTGTTWELTVSEMPWDENSEERKPALSLPIINGNIWATPQPNLFWRLEWFKSLPVLCHVILFVLLFPSRWGKCQNPSKDLLLAGFLSDWIQGGVLRNLMNNSFPHP